jgi:hypothetical protein
VYENDSARQWDLNTGEMLRSLDRETALTSAREDGWDELYVFPPPPHPPLLLLRARWVADIQDMQTFEWFDSFAGSNAKVAPQKHWPEVG